METAHVDLLEACGQGPASEFVVLDTGLLAVDAHSFDLAAPAVKLNIHGLPAVTYERWLRLRFAPPLGQVTAISLWLTEDQLVPGWTIRYGVTPIYRTPSNAVSTIATQTIPATEPTIANVGSTTIDAYAHQYSQWLVLQGTADGSLTDLAAKSVSLKYAWTES